MVRFNGAKFDFVECAAKAYHFVWENRKNVLAVSLPVLMVKIISFMGITALGLEDNILRQGLCLLPSHFFEGFVLAGLIGMATGFQTQTRTDILSSALVYVLLKLVLSVFIGLVFWGQTSLPEPATPAASEAAPPYTILVVLVMLGGTLWAFRLLWLYIPVALGYDMGKFLKQFKGWASSYYMMGLWIIAFTPLALFMVVCSEAFGLVIPGAHDDPPSAIYVQILAAFQAVMDYAISLVSSIGMAYGIMTVMKGENIAPPKFF